MSHDPFADPEPLIRRIYSYVAYRIGDGPDAEDVTSTTIERALRYRASYDPHKGRPNGWLIGIARTCVDDFLRGQMTSAAALADEAAPGELERDTVLRMSVGVAVAALDDFDRDLIALRYGADLSTRQIGQLLEMKANAVDVALHRARERLRQRLEAVGFDEARQRTPGVRPAAEPRPSS